MQILPPKTGLPTSSTVSVSRSSEDFETFLRMLTAQIQNQDPLSPMAADQFASQLASFSMVEQQTLTNQKIDSLVSVLQTDRIAAYASVVGREALHEEPFNFSGSDISLEIGDVADAEVKVVILDSQRTVVFESSLAAGSARVIWDGTDIEGRLVPVGTYTAELHRTADSSRLDLPVFTGALVEEIRFGGKGAELLLADGTVVNEASVKKLR